MPIPIKSRNEVMRALSARMTPFLDIYPSPDFGGGAGVGVTG